MSNITPFIKYFVEESLKKQSIAALLDSDINKACSNINMTPVTIKPRVTNTQPFKYIEPFVLNIYPSKDDSEEYLDKSCQLLESIHCINNQAVFEIRGNKGLIE